MTIEIDDTRKIEDIQKEFTQNFPFLKLEFFAKPHKKGEASSKNLMRNIHKTLGECRKLHTKGIIKITEKQKVSELEDLFSKVYGLSVQVFRRSGRIWLETTSTDDWTLAKQNLQAQEFSTFKESKK